MILKLVFVFERSMEKYGGASQWETSVPIPNTAIKPLNADDSVKAKIGSRRTKEALNQGECQGSGLFLFACLIILIQPGDEYKKTARWPFFYYD